MANFEHASYSQFYEISHLSSLLRLHLLDSANNYNMNTPGLRQKLELTRMSTLKMKKTQRKGNGVQLTWKIFTQGIRREMHGIIKNEFDNFVKIVQEIINNDSVSSEELFQYVHVVYKAITHRRGSRNELELHLGKISNDVYERAEKTAAKLKNWKSASTFARSKQESAKKKGNNGEFEEFGSTLEFHVLSQPDNEYGKEEKEEKKEYLKMHEEKKMNKNMHKIQSNTHQDEFDWDWLRRKCEKAASYDQYGHALITEEQFAKNILTICKSQKSDNQLQGELFDLLGYDNFDMVTTILTNRKRIRTINQPKKKKIVE